MNTKKCFEDFDEGFVFDFSVSGLTAGEIIEFAAMYDPQPFHLDENEAAKTHFGGLVASGFQTQLLCFQPFCREVLINSQAVGSPGIDELKWLRPWYPGETMDVSIYLENKKISAKHNDRGYLNFKMTAVVGSAPVLTMKWAVIMLTRTGVDHKKGL